MGAHAGPVQAVPVLASAATESSIGIGVTARTHDHLAEPIQTIDVSFSGLKKESLEERCSSMALQLNKLYTKNDELEKELRDSRNDMETKQLKNSCRSMARTLGQLHAVNRRVTQELLRCKTPQSGESSPAPILATARPYVSSNMSSKYGYGHVLSPRNQVPKSDQMPGFPTKVRSEPHLRAPAMALCRAG